MSHADSALYVSKELGRNTYSFYSDTFGDETGKFIELSQELRTAGSENEFELYYQPKIDLVTSKITGMEALLRWIKPRGGLLVPPTEFIPILEEIGLMPEVGDWATNEVGEAMGLNPGQIGVNLSERRFSSLAYLKCFPIDTIKVDRSFVRDMLVDKEDEMILDAILAIAKLLNFAVVAEGVETKEQCDALKEKGCKLGQGYLFSRPVRRDEMTKLLKKLLL
ncbi:diguanylate cyclase/phosphodiesterase (GGDEF & EAL domains) with PAS/PAC sensor(s) [uncultured Candidatus Thioglobus sp.]|nr:diguanylate cyclase/phosphodiesterase (GGDEF & EAL domains) with PAS/PAC sensor(s) [uncultured Candidatus Thioglobus sp.]